MRRGGALIGTFEQVEHSIKRLARALEALRGDVMLLAAISERHGISSATWPFRANGEHSAGPLSPSAGGGCSLCTRPTFWRIRARRIPDRGLRPPWQRPPTSNNSLGNRWRIPK